MTTGAGIAIVAGGVIPQRGSPSRSENVQGAGGSTSVRISLNGQETAGNPASSWKAVLASAGAFGADLDGKKAAPNSTSVPNTPALAPTDRKSTRLNSSHLGISYAVF